MHYKIILSPTIPTDLVNLISEIDEFKGRWELLKNIAPDRLTLLRKVATIASIGSSTRIEGAHLSDAQIDQLLSAINRHSFQSRDEEEVAGYADAMNLVFDSYEQITVTENHTKQLHGILLKHSSKDLRHKGEYKKLPNSVEAFNAQGKRVGIIFETTSPFQTPFAMRDLTEWYNDALKERTYHPLLIIGAFVVHFLAIHPFQDGNGRLSRVLTTLMLLREGYQYVPYCSLESIVEENKERYYQALRNAQKTFKDNHAGMEEWLRYFLHILKKQKSILQARIDQEAALSLVNIPSLSQTILTLATQRGKLTISDVVTLSKANRNTVKKHIAGLVQNHMLRKHGTGKGTWYTKV